MILPIIFKLYNQILRTLLPKNYSTHSQLLSSLFFFNNSPSFLNGTIKKNFIYETKTDALLSFLSFSSRTCPKLQLKHTNRSSQRLFWVGAYFGSDLTSLSPYSSRNNQCVSFTLQVSRTKRILRGEGCNGPSLIN